MDQCFIKCWWIGCLVVVVRLLPYHDLFEMLRSSNNNKLSVGAGGSLCLADDDD